MWLVGYTLPPEMVGSFLGLIVVGTIGSLVAVVRLRERVVRLEEWIRQYERENGKGGRSAHKT